MTKRFFTKAHSQDKPPKLPKPPSEPEFAIIRLHSGLVRRYNSAWLRMRRGQARGGQTLHRLGLAHRWTSESARKAALKRWKTRNRMNKQLGKRVGLPSKNRKPIDYPALRWHYAFNPRLGIWCDYPVKQWYRLLPNGDKRPLSERWALTYLGHLGRQIGRVPREVIAPSSGTKDAE